MKVKFTQFFDVSSNAEGFSTFKVKAGGDYVKQRCAPQFACYKYYKLGPVSVKLVPASTLPVDPTGLSYETGEATVDPRDMFNPGLVRITNGEDTKNISDMNAYYATLLDPRWYKFQLQQGFSRYAKPLVYNIGEIHQDVGPGQFVNMHKADSKGYSIVPGLIQDSTPVVTAYPNEYHDRTLLQTGRVKLGWMPTDCRAYSGNPIESDVHGQSVPVPEVDVITFVLPKAFKTKFYYRVFVESTVYFKAPVAVNPIVDNGYSYLPVDRFISMQLQNLPSGQNVAYDVNTIKYRNDGGAE